MFIESSLRSGRFSCFVILRTESDVEVQAESRKAVRVRVETFLGMTQVRPGCVITYLSIAIYGTPYFNAHARPFRFSTAYLKIKDNGLLKAPLMACRRVYNLPRHRIAY